MGKVTYRIEAVCYVFFSVFGRFVLTEMLMNVSQWGLGNVP